MPLVVSCNNPPGAVVGTPYSHFFQQTGGGAGTLIYIFPGILPSGLTLDNFTYEVSGTPDTVSWTPAELAQGYQSKGLTVTAFDPGAVAWDTIVCGIGSYLNCLPLTPTSNNPPNGSIGIAYSHALGVASGGIAPFVYTLTGGSLPTGLSLNADGTITGIPSANGYFPFTVTVTGAGSPVNNVAELDTAISIGGAAQPGTSPQIFFYSFGFLGELEIDCGDPPDGVVGAAYTHLIPIIPGGTEPYTFSISFGALPTGLSLDPDSGLITGTPTTVGTFNFAVHVEDSTVPDPQEDTVECSITINAALDIICDSPPIGAVGVPYSHFFPASGGVPPYNFTITSGTLPDGLTLDAATGEVSGTPTSGSVSPATFTVTDSYAGAAAPLTDSVECTITITGVGGLSILCDSPPAGNIGITYSHGFPASGGTSPYTFSIVSGSLPPGLTLDAATGIVSGRPTRSGVYEFTIRVTDNIASTADVTCSILIKQCLLVDLG